MRNIVCLLVFAVVIGCKKDSEIISSEKTDTLDSASLRVDSISAPVIENPVSQPFKVIPQEINVDLGRTIFTQNNTTLFYFDQESNKGNIVIDGKNFALTQFDFMENSIKLTGPQISIEAQNGIFQEVTSDCAYGDFPEISVTAEGKTLKLSNIKMQSCMQY